MTTLYIQLRDAQGLTASRVTEATNGGRNNASPRVQQIADTLTDWGTVGTYIAGRQNHQPVEIVTLKVDGKAAHNATAALLRLPEVRRIATSSADLTAQEPGFYERTNTDIRTFPGYVAVPLRYEAPSNIYNPRYTAG